MPRLTLRIPKHCHHKASGQAVVTLNGRDVYLGRYGCPESKATYKQLVAEWQVNSLRHSKAIPQSGPTVDKIILSYLEHAKSYYVKNGRATSTLTQLRCALRPLHELYGCSPAAEFGPLALKALREEFIRQRGWCRRPRWTTSNASRRLSMSESGPNRPVVSG